MDILTVLLMGIVGAIIMFLVGNAMIGWRIDENRREAELALRAAYHLGYQDFWTGRGERQWQPLQWTQRAHDQLFLQKLAEMYSLGYADAQVGKPNISLERPDVEGTKAKFEFMVDSLEKFLNSKSAPQG